MAGRTQGKTFVKSKKRFRWRIPFKGLWLILPIFLLSAGPAQGQEITVSAAIAFKESFGELGNTFEAREKGVRVRFNFGASGDLARQIAAGAPVEVFASSGLREMDELEQKGATIHGTRVNFARNKLVLAIPAASKAHLGAFPDLTRKEVQKIAIGNPRTVPAGRYAEELLRKLNLWEQLKDKLVFAENVRQVLDYVARNEVDAGLVYATDALIRSKELKRVLPAPEGSHSPVVYPIAAVKNGKNEKTARAFIAWVVSAEGQGIMARYGFKTMGRRE
jgi:molybdate transport system substrate-binding protein